MSGIGTELRRLIEGLRSQGLGMTMLAGIDKVKRWLTGEPLWRYMRISPVILLGAQPARSVLSKLYTAGVTGVINMREEYNYADEVGVAKLHYLYLPTPDNQPPSLENLRRGVEFIGEEISRGGSVYIHCWEGLGRSPTMAAAYLITTGCTPGDAWKQIRASRPFIRPTQTQIARLEEFARMWLYQPTRLQPEVVVAEVKKPDDPPAQQSG